MSNSIENQDIKPTIVKMDDPWVPLPFDCKYEVNQYGIVRRRESNGTIPKGYVLKPRRKYRMYYFLSMSITKIMRKTFKIDQFVPGIEWYNNYLELQKKENVRLSNIDKFVRQEEEKPAKWEDLLKEYDSEESKNAIFNPF